MVYDIQSNELIEEIQLHNSEQTERNCPDEVLEKQSSDGRHAAS